MEKLIYFSFFLLSSVMVFAAEIKESEPQQFELDYEFVVKVDSNKKLQDIRIHVSSALLARFENFAKLFAAHRSIEFNLSSQQEAWAFVKIIKFLHERSEPNLDFLDKADFAELMQFILYFEIESLGTIVGNIINQEVSDKIKTSSEMVILLDALSETKLQFLYDAVFSCKNDEHDWIRTIQNALYKYIHYLYIKKDLRLGSLMPKIDVNLCAQISLLQHKDYVENKKLRDQEIHEKNLAREQCCFDAEVNRIASRIANKFNQDVKSESCCGRHTITDPIQRQSFLVPTKYAAAVTEALKIRFPRFNIFINVCDWNVYAQFMQDEPWPKTFGGYLANCCAVGICLVATPFKWVSLCISCKDDGDDCCDTSIANAVSHCLYKMSTCGRRWIIIEPKEEYEAPMKPPKQQKDIMRTQENDYSAVEAGEV